MDLEIVESVLVEDTLGIHELPAYDRREWREGSLEKERRENIYILAASPDIIAIYSGPTMVKLQLT